MQGSLYRAVWRWHFYAGLIILPFLCWLAVTGSLYLFKPEIERAVYHDWIVLEAPARPMAVGTMAATVQGQTGGRVNAVTRPADPGESWRLTVELANGDRRTAFVDPADGNVLGSTQENGIMETVKRLHSLAITGPIGNALIEIVAGWAIILVVTGFYLWWPRGGSKALSLAGRPPARPFWRNLHASTGAVVGLVILFLAFTGLPWSQVWGGRMQAFIAAKQIGRPAAPSGGGAHRGHGEASLPWSMQKVPPPPSHHGDIGPDRAIAVAERQGLHAPWSLRLPSAPGQPYLVSAVPSRTGEVRVIYVDAGTGAVLQDARYADFGPGAKAFEWGIYTHQGQQYGEPNRLVMLAGCIGVLLLSISAGVMWWKRRLKTPPAPGDPRRARGLVALMLALGALFPLTGATMVAALIGEWVWRKASPSIG